MSDEDDALNLFKLITREAAIEAGATIWCQEGENNGHFGIENEFWVMYGSSRLATLKLESGQVRMQVHMRAYKNEMKQEHNHLNYGEYEIMGDIADPDFDPMDIVHKITILL